MLAALEQQGPLHRQDIGLMFRNPERRRMWPQAATRLAGSICRPLLDAGLIRENRSEHRFDDRWWISHDNYEITSKGKEFLRGKNGN